MPPKSVVALETAQEFTKNDRRCQVYLWRVRADLTTLEEQGFRCVAIHSSYSDLTTPKFRHFFPEN